MRGAVLYGPRDVRFEERDAPKILKPTDAIIRLSATCVCGSDLWPYRGINPTARPTPMGHEYCGIVEDVGSAVRGIKPGQFVIGSFFASDNTCPICRAGYQSSCQQAELIGGAQAPLLRLPLADGTLVGTRDVPTEQLIPSLLALSDVMGTGWFAADAARVKPGMSVAVVGDGAVGLLAVLSAKLMGAERIIAMSRHERSEEHTSELQSPCNLVCRLLLEKKKHKIRTDHGNGIEVLHYHLHAPVSHLDQGQEVDEEIHALQAPKNDIPEDTKNVDRHADPT